MDTKQCNVCNEVKPVSEFYFRKDRGEYRANCKKCKSKFSKQEVSDKASAPTKVCKHCGIEKTRDEYQKAGGGRWLQPYCKPCDAERKKKHSEKNIEQGILRRKKYYCENKEKIFRQKEEWTKKNIDKLKEWRKKHYIKTLEIKKIKDREYNRANKEIISLKSKQRIAANHDYYKAKAKAMRENRTPEQKEKQRQYQKDYKIKGREKLKAWRKNNAERLRERKRLWSNKKSASDIEFKILKNLRSRARAALNKGQIKKVDTTEKLLGCTIPFFKEYFKSLFTEGMTWELFLAGKIHIDHIKPCCKFDLTKEDEQRACFYYKNLQPLFWEDNLKKGKSYE